MLYKTVIAVFCYKRAEKLRRSMEALAANPESENMDVLFFCDGPRGEQDRPGVEATRAYIDSLPYFGGIEKHYHERNVGTGPNFVSGLRYLCENYDQFLVIEDDLVVTPNYIRYMLDSLDYYRREKSVFCVTGFNFPIRAVGYGYDTLIAQRFCSYGWASWSNRVCEVVWDEPGLRHLMRSSPDFKLRLNSEGMDLYRMLIKQLKGRISTWDIQMQVHVSERNLKVVYPLVSKATNIGFDMESTNTFGVDYLRTVLDPGRRRSFCFCDARTMDRNLQRQVRRPYRLGALVKRKLLNTMIKLSQPMLRLTH